MSWEHYKALMYKNYILWKRRKLETLIEVLSPFLILFLLAYLRDSTTIEETEAASYLENARYIHPETFGTVSYNFTKAASFGLCQSYAASGGDWIIGLAPENNITSYIRDKIAEFPLLYRYDVVFFKDDDDLEDYVTDEDYEDGPKLCFAVIFEKAENKVYEYSIRFNQTYTVSNDDELEGSVEDEIDIFNTEMYEPTDELIVEPKPEFHWQFLASGFVQIQNWVDNYILQEITGNSEALITSGFVPMYFDDWLDDPFLEGVGFLLGFFMIVIMVIPMCRMIALIVREKEEKITQNMYTMGLSNRAFWLSCLTYYVCFYILLSLALAYIFAAFVFNYSSFLLLLLVFLLFSMSCISFGAIMSIIFTNSRAAVVMGLLFYIAGFFLYFTVDDVNVSESSKNWASLIPSVGLALFIRNVVGYEIAYKGLDTDTLNSTFQNYKFSTVYWMTAISTGIFIFIALYLDQCWPDERGVKRPWYFLFTKSFWTEAPVQKPYFPEDFAKGANEEPYNYKDLSKSIKIRNASKNYGDFTAVNDLNLNIYYGQITAILGHNGAGKTTLISLITGALSLSEGDIKVHEYFVSENIEKIRKMLGVCPQYNIIYPELTVYEHLYIYSVFKGVKGQDIEDEITDILVKTTLLSRKDALAEGLSGGEKRKLCIGIALIGGSKIVILDEPTSGLDVSSRRQLLDVLKNFKGNRIVILTTHYVEEADVLADRIIIMHEGGIMCSGSSMHLKNLYGSGYYITFFKLPESSDEIIKNFVKALWPSAKIFSNSHAEIAFRVPSSESQSFSIAFQEIDDKKESIGVSSYVISLSTLEEVFIKAYAHEPEIVEEDEKTEENDFLIPQEKQEKGVLVYGRICNSPFCHSFRYMADDDC